MTPDELNRTIDFVIQSQARLAVAQEQDREQRAELQCLTRQIVTLIEHQSRRLERYEAWQRAWQEELRREAREAEKRLDRILDRLSDKLN
jgi:hypothetical protein